MIDLRGELEKRDLDKTGVKAALIERLSHALRDEGEDPESYEFEVPAEPTPIKKTPTKRVNKKLSQDNESETQSNDGAHEAGDSDYEEEAEVETLDEEDEDSYAEGDAKAAGDDEDEEDEEEAEEKSAEPAAEAGKPEKKKEAAKPDPAKDEDGQGGTESEQALIVHVDDNHDLDGDMEEDEGKASDVKVTNNTTAAKTPAAKKAEAAKAQKEAAEAAKTETKKTPAKAKAAAAATTAVKTAKVVPKVDKETIRNLWVSGLANTTRAADLKALFGKHGKVVSAKIVTNAKTPGDRKSVV